jgi:alpha-glucoside transport system substrate-binding protein
MNKRWLKLAAVPVVLSFVAASCGSDDDSDSGSSEDTTAATEASAEGDTEAPAEGDTQDFGGAKVLITGSERDDPSVAAINDTLQAWAEPLNINVEFAGDADWEANINTQVEGGNPPNIAFFPQPGKLAEFYLAGDVKPLSDAANAATDEFWIEGFQVNAAVDGVQYGIPVKTDLKSLVWYQPGAFADAGYEVPETYDEFVALVDQMTADGGGKALCVGIESGQGTGWTYTDWVEEMVLRLHGADVYDQWVANEVAFDDPRIIEAMQAPVDLWTEENVFASGGSIAATNFADNGQPLVDGQCYMHRQANFFGGLFPVGTTFADPDDPTAVDVFYFPDINDDTPVLTAGNFAAAFDEEPATDAVMQYLATAEYAETRQRNQTAELGGGVSGFLSAAQGQDPSVYTALEQSFLEILGAAEIARFDGSDLMPADVGAGTFWSEGVSLVNGDIDAATAAARIQESWPS